MKEYTHTHTPGHGFTSLHSYTLKQAHMFMSPNPIAWGLALMCLCNVKMLHESLVSVSGSRI